MFPSSNLPTNLAFSPADTPHVNASAHLKVSVNGNTPSGPNTLDQSYSRFKNAFDLKSI